MRYNRGSEKSRKGLKLVKFLHTSDWHIGRTLNGWSLLEEQKHAFKIMLAAAKQEKVDGIIIAGDLYDRTVPSAAAVTTFNEMLREMNIQENFPIYAISGNHDGARRLNYGREWMEFNHLHLNTLLEEAFVPIETAEIQMFLLPYFDPADARVYFLQAGMPEEEVKEIKTLSQALELVLEKMREAFHPEKKQILVTHFAVSPSADQEIELTSETKSKAGGLATVTVQQFVDFDYVALGHIHTHHASPSETVRYSGSPVKFNIKEAKTKKGYYIVNVADKVETEFFEIQPQTDLVALAEEWETLLDPEFYQQQPLESAWFAICIKNFDRFAHAGQNLRAQLQKIYGTIVELDYEDKERIIEHETHQNMEMMSEEEIVQNFYQQVAGEVLSPFQRTFIEETFIDLRGEK